MAEVDAADEVGAAADSAVAEAQNSCPLPTPLRPLRRRRTGQRAHRLTGPQAHRPTARGANKQTGRQADRRTGQRAHGQSGQSATDRRVRQTRHLHLARVAASAVVAARAACRGLMDKPVPVDPVDREGRAVDVGLVAEDLAAAEAALAIRNSRLA